MNKLVVSPKAYDDLLQILHYIANDRPAAGVAFVDQLQEQCKFLARFPDSGTKLDELIPNLRVFSYRGYGIYFRKLEEHVRIERVLAPGLDTSRNIFE
jgi:toxin ParE1/3/4